ncbi:uncharacterized protein LOC125675814 [Ostrea edulis]|uniref:uncharacterized protein LOC125675814 n=1 Tax=Ostrea edulis TaxID=37623 RepID=UPI002094317D|nr:uncharacterized protein LOC125675814 [Ostrea edulis]XP_048769582.1 uncharacterized protein LOC125675814 [Ostrea edulis]XP_056015513.1 uncharacterized protein LOC125675814 [Ostrea edulis]XP_056015514.1 uncharacterized protein LOC125675814 [Ostrea edulis]
MDVSMELPPPPPPIVNDLPGSDNVPAMEGLTIQDSPEGTYCTTEEIIYMQQKANKAKQGINRISEKYDAVDKFGPQSKKELSGSRERLTISDPTPSGSNRPGLNVCNFAEGVTEEDLLQVDMFYRSHKTEVFVCQCLANLYFGKVKANQDQWKFAMTGIPVLILDTGDHHRNRKLQIVLAEKGTGFLLWKDDIDHLSTYKAEHPNYHTMSLSTDHTKLAGLSFDHSTAASDFHSTIEKLTSNPDDELMSLSKTKHKRRKSEKKKVPKYKPPKKTEISTPCCFVHVTKLERPALDLTADHNIISGPMHFENVLDQSPNVPNGSQMTLGSESSSVYSDDLGYH